MVSMKNNPVTTKLTFFCILTLNAKQYYEVLLFASLFPKKQTPDLSNIPFFNLILTIWYSINNQSLIIHLQTKHSIQSTIKFQGS